MQDLLELTHTHTHTHTHKMPFSSYGTRMQKQEVTRMQKQEVKRYQTPSSNNTRDDSTHGHHQMVNIKIRLIIFFADKDEGLKSQKKKKKKTECCVSDHKFFIAKFRLIKERGENLRSFKYELSQISYDYTVEVRNRFKGLDLTDSI